MRRLVAIILVCAFWLVPATAPAASRLVQPSPAQVELPTPALGSFGTASTVSDFVPPNPYAYGNQNGGQFHSMASPALKPDVKEDVERVYPNPITGQAKILVILMDFTDVTFDPAHDANYWQTMLFSTAPGAKSLANYYAEVSNGQFTVSGSVAPIVVHSGSTMEYYGADTATGGLDRANGPIYEMAREAVQKLDAAGFDFRPFDQTDLADRNGNHIINEPDGYVDHLMIIHAGPGQEGNPPVYGTNAIWSHRGSIYPAQTVDGIQAANYTTEPEDGEMGVFAHEFGHDLGLPDLYDISSSTSEGIGKWDLMAGGSWNFVGSDLPGTTPAGLSAWSKVKLGWLTPAPISANQNGLAIAAGAADRLDVPGTSGKEYFLLENRQQTGFDAGIPGHGLLVWHVDDAISPPDNTDNSSEVIHPRVALVQADGLLDLEKGVNRGDSGDPFPGSFHATDFNDATAPNGRGYTGLDSYIALSSIAENTTTGVVSLNVSVANPTPFTSLTVSSSAFSPNSDGYKDTVTAAVYTSEPTTVAFAVYNAAGATFATGGDPAYALSHSFTWDGINQATGLNASDDRYSISVTASVYGGPSYTDQIFVTLDSVPPLVDTLQLSASTAINTTDPVLVSFGYFNNAPSALGGNDNTAKDGNVIFQLWQNGIRLENSLYHVYHSDFYPLIRWWPTDASGNAYPNGSYDITIVADDGANQTSATVPVTVAIPVPSTPPPSGGSIGSPGSTPTVSGKSETVTIHPDGGETALFGGTVKLLLDSGSVDADLVVTASVVNSDGLPAPDAWLSYKSNVISFGADEVTFQKPLTLVMGYNPSDLNGADADRLGIYYLNPASNRWEYVGGKVDPQAHTVSARLSHFSRYTVFLSSRTFADVADHWAKDSVELLAAKGIVDGNDQGEFRPNAAITRGEFAKLLARAVGLPAATPQTSTFSDVTADDWYFPYVEALAKDGIVTGYAGAFRPNDLVTRQDMMVMVARALGGAKPSDTSVLGNFSDAGSVSAYAQQDAAAAVAAGLFSGDGDGALRPANHATRAEAATVILRLMRHLATI